MSQESFEEMRQLYQYILEEIRLSISHNLQNTVIVMYSDVPLDLNDAIRFST